MRQVLVSVKDWGSVTELESPSVKDSATVMAMALDLVLELESELVLILPEQSTQHYSAHHRQSQLAYMCRRRVNQQVRARESRRIRATVPAQLFRPPLAVH